MDEVVAEVVATRPDVLVVRMVLAVLELPRRDLRVGRDGRRRSETAASFWGLGRERMARASHPRMGKIGPQSFGQSRLVSAAPEQDPPICYALSTHARCLRALAHDEHRAGATLEQRGASCQWTGSE